MRRGNSDPLPPELAAQLEALEGRTDADIDTREMPEVQDWKGAQRGRYWRPTKRLITLRLDADLLEYFREDGEGYQTRLNEALREWVAAHPKRAQEAG